MMAGRNTRKSTMGTGMPDVERCAETKAITRKNTSAPTRSSNAAMGISVLVTGPEVFKSRTTEREGAGAVASAMPPNRKARYSGVPVNQKVTPNTRLTTTKVPRDSVIVVIRICDPALFICFQISSVPIIRPNVHSRILSATLNHVDSNTELFNRSSACGPMIMPAISQPRIEGSFNLEMSLPAAKAIRIDAKSRSRPVRNSIRGRSLY